MTQQNEEQVKLDEASIPEISVSEESETGDSEESQSSDVSIAEDLKPLDLPEIAQETLIDGSGAYPDENEVASKEEADQSEAGVSAKSPFRFAFAVAAALALVVGVGGAAYASGTLASLKTSGDSPAPAKEEWMTLSVYQPESTGLLAAGSSVTQTVSMTNHVVGQEGLIGYIQEDAYVRVHVAIPVDVNNFDSNQSDDILQVLPAEGVASSWASTGAYKTSVHGVQCHVRVFVYPKVLTSGSATDALAEVFRINPLCDVDADGSKAVYIKDGARFECNGSIPVYVCSEAVQADVWEPVGATELEKAESVLNAAFGAIDANYQCELKWAKSTI